MADDAKPQKWRLVRGTNLKTEDRHVLLTLFLFQGDNAAAFCKQETLADEIGVDPRSVRRSLSRLNAAGIVRSEWAILNGVPMRTYAIDFQKLKTVQRADGRTPASYPETIDGRTPASATVGHQRPDHQDTSVLQEDPLNIQGTFTLQNSPNSGRASDKKRPKKTDSKLIEFCHEWNAWHSAGIVRQKIRDVNSPGKGIEDAWKRSQRDKEQRERLNDFPELRKAIEGSQQFLNDARWFDAAGLIGGKNANRRWYAEQLVAGAYLNKPGGGGHSQSPEASQAWQKTLEAVRLHSSYRPDEIRKAIGERAFQALKSIGGAKQVEKSNDFERRELEKRFIQAFSEGPEP